MRLVLLLACACGVAACDPTPQPYATERPVEAAPSSDTGISVSGYARVGVQKG